MRVLIVCGIAQMVFGIRRYESQFGDIRAFRIRELTHPSRRQSSEPEYFVQLFGKGQQDLRLIMVSGMKNFFALVNPTI